MWTFHYNFRTYLVFESCYSYLKLNSLVNSRHMTVFQIICNYPIPLLKSLKIETIYLWKLLLQLYCLYKCGNKAKLCNLHWVFNHKENNSTTLLGSTGFPLICTTGPGWVLHFLDNETKYKKKKGISKLMHLLVSCTQGSKKVKSSLAQWVQVSPPLTLSWTSKNWARASKMWQLLAQRTIWNSSPDVLMITRPSKERDGDNVEGMWCLEMKAKWLSLRLSSGCLQHTKLNSLLSWFKLLKNLDIIINGLCYDTAR